MVALNARRAVLGHSVERERGGGGIRETNMKKVTNHGTDLLPRRS